MTQYVKRSLQHQRFVSPCGFDQSWLRNQMQCEGWMRGQSVILKDSGFRGLSSLGQQMHIVTGGGQRVSSLQNLDRVGAGRRKGGVYRIDDHRSMKAYCTK